MASKRTIVIKLCLFLHILEVLLGTVLTVFSILLQNAADVSLAETPSWLGIPCALFGLVGIVIIVLNKLKEELVFVLVFHGLIIGLCAICIILVAPKVVRWEPVASYQTSGKCQQVSSRCNCTKSLPTRVYKCADLTGIYDLALIIAVIVGLCLAIAILAAYFDFLIISRYVPKDTPLQPAVQVKKGAFDEEQLVDSFEEIGHIGPLNTPDLVPKLDDEVPPRINSVDWNRSEADVALQEDFPERARNSIGSAASLTFDQVVIGSRPPSYADRMRSASMPNSVTGSKQSIRSRKDTLLRRLQSVQARDHEDQNGDEDDQDEAILNELEKSSRSSSYARLKGAGGGEQNTNGKHDSQYNIHDVQENSYDVDRSNNDGKGAGNFPKGKPDRGQSRRSASESNFRKHSLHEQIDVKLTERSMSEGNVLENVVRKNSKSKSLRQLKASDSIKIPGEGQETLIGSNCMINRMDKDENSAAQHPKDADCEGLSPEPFQNPSRRSGYENRDFHGLPPLPLKDIQTELSVQDRTFSAPSLPYFDANRDASSGAPIIARPGSSGSQVLFRNKKKTMPHTRNDLIDKQSLLHQNNEAAFEDRSDVISEDYDGPIRKNSFETDSTDVDLDDRGQGSEASDEQGRKPRWHPPWQLKQEIIAHRDAVPVLAIEPKNRWFASGSTDKTIKIWDINSGNCRLTVKGHKAGVRALSFGSSGHRYIFSAADDRQLLCTDIEVNRIVSHYPDQSSVIYAMAMYRQADLLVTCGRDKYVKIWDTREKKCIKTMRGHMNTVSSVAILENSGQIVSGSHDSTMRIWDIGEGRCTQILTGHEKSVRSIVVHPEEPLISSASTERIIHWNMPDGEKLQEITPTDISINCIAVNPQGALVAAGSNGVIHLWDWKSGHKFQKIHRTRVYESQEVPICVFSVVFDKSGSRLLVSDASNIIKVYGEAYTRVRRRFNNAEETKKGRSKSSRFSTFDNAFM